MATPSALSGLRVLDLTTLLAAPQIAAMLAHEGQLDWNETLPLRDQDKVSGSGVLSDLSAGLRLSLRDLCQLTIVLSDNTATNMLIDRLGMDAINARIAALGLMHTRLQRKAFTPDTPATLPYGLGVSTPRETADLLRLLEKLSRRTWIHIR